MMLVLLVVHVLLNVLVLVVSVLPDLVVLVQADADEGRDELGRARQLQVVQRKVEHDEKAAGERENPMGSDSGEEDGRVGARVLRYYWQFRCAICFYFISRSYEECRMRTGDVTWSSNLPTGLRLRRPKSEECVMWREKSAGGDGFLADRAACI
eukprot:CAMPEP_0178988488 /NCGR_PEP_ID=MMETSP0795-20121207/3837_1 /TAXON_ID=88552 /ORGANISM="Amoebophrya sp., Strain Ameob2" /LENGTH=153 /DNA_ID=CAMNT_0020679765 /DNA_START=749 /DNA_END=1210 /DNA_ORIENTATION=+